MEQRRLARSRRPAHGDEGAARDVQIHVRERFHAARARAQGACQLSLITFASSYRVRGAFSSAGQPTVIAASPRHGRPNGNAPPPESSA